MAKVKSNKKFSVPSLVAIILTVLILFAFVFSLVDFSGLKLRMEKTIKSDNFTLTSARLQYMFKNAFNEWYNQYYYYIYLGYISYDSSVSMKNQEISSGTTYYDYFKTITENTAKQIILYNEAALADSTVDYKQLDKEAAEYVKTDVLPALKSAAKSNSVSLSTYITNVYGSSVRQSDIEYCEKLSYIASNYSTTVYNRFKDALTEDDLVNEFKNDLATYVSAELLKYEMKSTYAVATVDSTKYEGGEDSEEYKQALADAKKTAKEKNDIQKEIDDAFALELGKAETDEAFIKLVLNREYDDIFTSAYNDAVEDFADADKPDDTVLDAFKNDIKENAIEAAYKGEETIDVEASDDSEWETAKKELVKTIVSELTTEKDGLKTTVAYSLEKDFDKWVFGGVKGTYGIEYAEGEDKEGTSAKVGDFKNFETIDDADAGKYTIDSYRVVKAASRDDSATRNYGHILFTDDTYENAEGAKAKAEEILAEIKKGTLDKATFETFGKQYTEDSNVFYDNSVNGTTVLDDWLFAATAGDIEVVESEYGAHIVYYVGEGIETWKANAIEAVSTDKANDWYKALPYTINIVEENFDNIIK